MSAELEFETLETTYGGFRVPSLEITIGSTTIDSDKVPITSLTVDIDAGNAAGGCTFTVDSLYNYETGVWGESLLSTIEVDKSISIKMGYATRKEVFYGYVDDFSISYESGSAPQITVNGLDAKGFLMNQRGAIHKTSKTTNEVVTGILQVCKDKGKAKSITVGSITEYIRRHTKTTATDYQFLCFLSSIYNMQFFVVNGEIIFDDVMKDTDVLIELEMGVSLLSFTRNLSIRNQAGSVTIVGRDEKNVKIEGKATAPSIQGFEGKSAKSLATGVADTELTEENQFVSTTEECTQLAQARLNELSMNLVKGSGQCIGIPEIVPGRHIKLTGMDSKCNTNYYITKVTHEFSADTGYLTSFEVRGPKG